MGKKKQEIGNDVTGEVSGQSPYLWARRQWDFAIIRSHRGLLVWQVTAIVSLVLLTFSVMYGYTHISKPKLQPYVIEVDPSSGNVRFAGMLQGRMLEANDAVIRNYLIDFIKSTRSVSTDMVVLKRTRQQAYFMATRSAQNQITQMVQQEDPFTMAQQNIRRDIKFRLFERVSEQTWRAEWTEQMRQDGVITEQVAMSGTFSFTRAQPETPEEAEQNPFGLYFDSFDMGEVRL